MLFKALALDALPEGADAAKDLGIWHMSFVSIFFSLFFLKFIYYIFSILLSFLFDTGKVLPQVIAPVIAGQILNSLKHRSYTLGTY